MQDSEAKDYPRPKTLAQLLHGATSGNRTLSPSAAGLPAGTTAFRAATLLLSGAAGGSLAGSVGVIGFDSSELAALMIAELLLVSGIAAASAAACTQHATAPAAVQASPQLVCDICVR